MIKSVNLKGVSHETYYQIMFLTIGFLSKENLEELKLSDVKAAFEKAFKAYDDAFKQARKTGLKELKDEIDILRDDLVLGFYHTLAALLRFSDDDINNAAKRLLDVMDKYGGTGIAYMPQGDETSAITNALQELSEEDLTATGTKLWAEQLQIENNRFADIHAQKTEKEAEYITGLLADERKKLDTQFRHLCKTIDSLAYIFGKEAYQILANNINQLVANTQQSMKQKASARKTRKSKEE